MFGVLSRTKSTWGCWYFITFIDDYSHCTWLFLMKTQAELFSIFHKFHAEVQTQLILQFVSYEVIMPKNIFLDHSPTFCPQMGFFISPRELTLFNRMEWLSIRTVIWLKLLKLSYSIIRFLNIFRDATLAACYLINSM